ncbi:hypothetical protein A6A08_19675 [Nocardiopsis sp. TSRI0078]|uniref:DUF3566 domain-containing protein n=1 Tax=unclassified Nocardiopsis TaxID=2649073 RepID=UPI00093C9847|nr:DUF3566 domain-containing protein [Nocardiopsis sp. TSRI0078]OKI22481.1 hypothetical protein A6A08_19675 [Nocardiopsis sp. TSRI0078]
MSDNQRNTTTNESDPDTAGSAGGGDVETAEKDTVEAGAAVTAEADEASGQKDAAEAGKASGEEDTTEAEEKASERESAAEADEASGSEDAVGTADEQPSVPAGPDVAEDRAEAGGTPVSESKSSVPESPSGPSAVKASLSSRKAHLTVSRVEPWSVMKFSFVVSLVCFIVLFVAVAVIYATLSMLGVFDELTNMMNALLEGDGAEDDLGLNPAAWFSPGRVLGYTGVVGALNIVLITALSTVGAMLYNLVADLVGGVDVTLSEAE